MHWRESLIKSEDIKWKPMLKVINDNNLDFNLHLPLTALFEAQARQAFAFGMVTMMKFHIGYQGDEKPIEIADVIKLFNDCGLPEVAKKIS